MMQKENEFPDKCDFKKKKGHAHTKEKGKNAKPADTAIILLISGIGAKGAERQEDKRQARGQGLNQGGDKYQIAPFKQRHATSAAAIKDLRQCPPLHEIKKVGPVVRGRPDIEFVLIQKFISFVIKQRLCAQKKIRHVKDVVMICLFD